MKIFNRIIILKTPGLSIKIMLYYLKFYLNNNSVKKKINIQQALFFSLVKKQAYKTKKSVTLVI